MTRHGRGGFANPEPLILIAILAILAAIIIPNIVRAVQRRRSAVLIVEVNRVRAAEDAFYVRHHRWVPEDSIALIASPGIKLDDWRSDSTGWRVVVTADTGKAAGRYCAMFDGGDLFRPNSHVGQPRELACW